MNVTNENKEIIVLGDINCNYLKANDHQDIKNLFQVQGLKQIIKSPTRITENSETLIDVIYTNNQKNITYETVVPSELSDHDMVGCVRKINSQTYKPKTIMCRNFNNYNHLNVINDVLSVNWDPLYR